MKVCIAEKPSVARSIAAILGATSKKDGYLEGNGYAVTWAFGHLVSLAMPEEYGYEGFKREDLPIIPTEFKLVPKQIKDGKTYKSDPGVLKQLKIIKELFNRADRIIVCMDSGREGENIFRYIYTYLNCHKPFERLWISSLTDKAIRDGFQNLKPGTDYDSLYLAAKMRSEADWLIGYNGSRALTIAAGEGVYSLGRVQTPTLAMICSRYLENKNFVCVPYWQHKLNLSKDDIQFSAISVNKFETLDEADRTGERIYQGGIAKVRSIEKKTLNQEPPLLYDLTTLQKEANSKYGFSADKTLSIAQGLYEKTCITYPRTGSRYISTDVFDEMPQLIEVLRAHEEFEPYIRFMDNKVLTLKAVDEKKVTDHHALLITENFPTGLTKDEQQIYNMIAGRMLEAFSPVCVKEQTTVTFDAREYPFVVKQTKAIKMGWRGVFAFDHIKMNEEEGSEDHLPELKEGDELEIDSLEVLEKQTKPKPLHTESSLLGAMEAAGKNLADEELRQSIKDCGIGTPATRAAIIETLLSRDYIKREKKSLIPTEKGLSVYDVVKEMRIADVEMTGQWESALLKIERGEYSALTFQKAIETHTCQITEEILACKIQSTSRKSCLCPKCRTGQMQFYSKVVKCNNSDCGYPIFKMIASKELSDKQIQELAENGKAPVIKGFISKSGKSFDASLSFDEQFKIVFNFPAKKGKKKNW